MKLLPRSDNNNTNLRIRQSFRRKARASALVELVFGFVCLIPMIGLLLWISIASIRHSEVTVTTRNEVWLQRFQNKNGYSEPFQFKSEGALQREQSRRVTELGPPFDQFPEVSARSDLNTGSWDWRQIKLDRPPHWKLAKQLALQSQPQKIRNGTGDLPPQTLSLNFGNKLQEILTNRFKDMVQRSLGPILPTILGSNPEVASQLDRRRREIAEQTRRIIQQAKRLIDDAESNLRALQDQLTTVSREIQNWEVEIDELKSTLEDAIDDRAKQIEEQIEALEELVKTKKDRQADLINEEIPVAADKLNKAKQWLSDLEQQLPNN